VNQAATPSDNVSPLSLEPFERLLRRAALNFRLIDLKARAQRAGNSHLDLAPIGEAAGILWQILLDDGPSRFSNLMDEVNVPESVFFMAVGWLAREGKIEFEPDGGDYRIRLK
jgi:Winged helix-turn-helix domain (DUF2582)